MWTIFKVCMEFVTILFLCYALLFWLQACEILAPQGMEHAAPPLEGKVLTTGLSGKFSRYL